MKIVDGNFAAEAIVAEAQARLQSALALTIFTGAGISVAAGLPTLSGPGCQSIWEYNLIEDLLSAEKQAGRKRQLIRWLDAMLLRVRGATPSAAHHALARLAQRFPRSILITQNIDGLHARVGGMNTIEMHGAITRARCCACGARCAIEGSYQALFQTGCACGGEWRADLLYYDEAMAETVWRNAEAAARHCEVFIIIGSSGQVLPGGLLPAIAKRAGAYLIEFNLMPTELTPHCDVTMIGDCQQIAPAFIDKMLLS
jgi:NAD-dependent deacetylase